MDYVFLFPGQGSQFPGMGKILYKNFDYAKQLYNDAQNILNYDIKSICFNNNDKLNLTKYTQPAVFIYNMIINNYIRDLGYNPIATAGHSLGEYSSLVCANVLNFQDALLIIKKRAEKMDELGNETLGMMAAILYTNIKIINKLINEFDNKISIANYNSKNQVIISGKINNINSFINYAKKNGIKKILPLNVSGAFHSSLMKNARIYLEKVIKSYMFNDANIPVYQNTNPSINVKSTDIKNNLLSQIDQPVLWYQIITNMRKAGYDNFIEVGPKQVLTKLNKQILPKANTLSSETLNRFLNINV